jgi:hypothetical protein
MGRWKLTSLAITFGGKVQVVQLPLTSLHLRMRIELLIAASTD